MKKIFLLFLLISACGYQPLYNIKEDKLLFKELQLSGDKEINRKIISSLKIKENQTKDSNTIFFIESSKKITETSKDSRGQPETYRTNVIIKLVIKDLDKIIKTKVFEEDFSYDNRDNKYDLLSYQNDIENNLVNKIIEDIILFINL
tara:strand:+ start:781 stop:1221 length:441 start_codon:yes stop_codon:yes gene_type:complete